MLVGSLSGGPLEELVIAALNSILDGSGYHAEDRLLPPPLARRVVIPAAEPAAVLPHPPRGVRVVNRLFDATPLRLVTWVVTEEGTMEPATVKRRLAR